jgi:hypothetical protein
MKMKPIYQSSNLILARHPKLGNFSAIKQHITASAGNLGGISLIQYAEYEVLPDGSPSGRPNAHIYYVCATAHGAPWRK